MLQNLNLKRIIAIGILFTFWADILGPAPCAAQAKEFILPMPGKMVALSPAYSPAVIKGIKLDPNNPFRFHFFVDTGDDISKKEQLKQESSKLIKYFLASLTIPEEDLWVNLSPYEKNRIVPQEFGQTEMGRDLLAEDYLLKQITSSLIYPESQLGKEFWKKVYAKAQAKYGTTNIPIDTFNKVWIVPDKAVVYENGGTAFVLENHLKVMLEEDYLSMQKHGSFLNNGTQSSTSKQLGILGANISREIVIPALDKEVNQGKNFARLRQVFYSLILATWYKNKIKDSILTKIYEDKKKVLGVGYGNSLRIEAIYQRYLQAFKKGTYNYIKEEPDALTGKTIPRKYFSGGVTAELIDKNLAMVSPNQISHDQMANLSKKSLVDVMVDAAMISQAPNLIKDRAQTTVDYNSFVNDTREDVFQQGFSGIRGKLGESIEQGFNHNYLLAFSMYAYLYASFLTSKKPHRPLSLIIAQDPRPSGPAMRDAMVKGFLAAGKEAGIAIKIIDIGVFTTPMAESAIRTFKADGGVIITASHNPVDDNGIKLMTSSEQIDGQAAEGALLGVDEMEKIVDDFQFVRNSEENFNQLRDKLASTRDIPPSNVIDSNFNKTREEYFNFILSLFRHRGLEALRGKHIVTDSNGGAAAGRLRDEDQGHAQWVFTRLGMKTEELNKELGRPNHDIEPSEDSEGLRLMDEYLKKSGILLGIVMDFDADRSGDKLGPQTIAALNVAIALSWMDTYHLADHQNVVVVAHDATSMRVDAIARLFSRPGREVRVRRVETGEINVVSAMQEERKKGNFVPVGVEGANGGTVFMESTSRDGIVSGILKGLALFNSEIYKTWSDTLLEAGLPSVAGQTLSDIVRSLPEPKRETKLKRISGVKMDIPTLKSKMEGEFKVLWGEDSRFKNRYKDYQILHYEGTKESSSLSKKGKGGWRILLTRLDGEKDFLWVRPSKTGTEPALRYLVDATGPEAFNLLENTFIAIYEKASGERVNAAMMGTNNNWIEDDDSLVKSNKHIVANRAMNANAQKDGGIDFNPSQMIMQVKKEGKNFHFNFNRAEIDTAQVAGVSFTIRQMTPVTNLLFVLGLGPKPANKLPI